MAKFQQDEAKANKNTEVEGSQAEELRQKTAAKLKSNPEHKAAPNLT